jgi:hypothetical protein
MLRQLGLFDAEALARRPEQHRPRARRASVDDENDVAHRQSLRPSWSFPRGLESSFFFPDVSGAADRRRAAGGEGSPHALVNASA